MSHTSVSDYMDMAISDFLLFREALINVLEKEQAARNEALQNRN